jgi:hypothetical protein
MVPQKFRPWNHADTGFAEISDEIKGERLRFVEAMKEATAINVQRKQQPNSNNSSTD